MKTQTRLTVLALLLLFYAPAGLADGHAKQWVTYPGGDGPGKGKHIVLISGDDEYRSEEALPMLGKILSVHHGFKCTVLFAINDKGDIQPNFQTNIPGLEVLKDADLVIMGLRFRNLPDEQMDHIDAYLNTDKPIIGLRTSTHAFATKSEKYKKYHWQSKEKGWEQGFGKQVFGETWVAHHGAHGREATRGVITEAAAAANHPVVRGITPGSIWGDSDVYTINLPLPGDSEPIVLGAVLTGMGVNDPPVANQKNKPMMPVTWTKTYKAESGEVSQILTTTMGAATDLAHEGTRRMVVNGVYWILGMGDQVPAEGTNVEFVGEFKPTPFGFGNFKKGTKPGDYELNH